MAGRRPRSWVASPCWVTALAVGSSVLHNLLFSVLGLEPWNTFAANASAMVAGDFVGTLLAVVIVFLMLRLYRKRTA